MSKVYFSEKRKSRFCILFTSSLVALTYSQFTNFTFYNFFHFTSFFASFSIFYEFFKSWNWKIYIFDNLQIWMKKKRLEKAERVILFCQNRNFRYFTLCFVENCSTKNANERKISRTSCPKIGSCDLSRTSFRNCQNIAVFVRAVSSVPKRDCAIWRSVAVSKSFFKSSFFYC